MTPMRKDGSKKLVGATKILSQGDVEEHCIQVKISKIELTKQSLVEKKPMYDMPLEVTIFSFTIYTTT